MAKSRILINFLNKICIFSQAKNDIFGGKVGNWSLPIRLPYKKLTMHCIVLRNFVNIFPGTWTILLAARPGENLLIVQHCECIVCDTDEVKYNFLFFFSCCVICYFIFEHLFRTLSKSNSTDTHTCMRIFLCIVNHKSMPLFLTIAQLR